MTPWNNTSMTLFLFIRNKSRDPTGLQTYLDLDHLTNANSSCAYWLLWLCLKPGNWFETTDQRWSIGCLVVANCLSEVDLSKWRVKQAQAACGKFVSSEQTFMRTCGLFMRRMSPCPCFMESSPLHRIAIITHVVFTNQPTTALSVVVALEHSRVLAIFCSTVFPSDHPCIHESKQSTLNTWVRTVLQEIVSTRER